MLAPLSFDIETLSRIRCELKMLGVPLYFFTRLLRRLFMRIAQQEANFLECLVSRHLTGYFRQHGIELTDCAAQPIEKTLQHTLISLSAYGSSSIRNYGSVSDHTRMLLLESLERPHRDTTARVPMHSRASSQLRPVSNNQAEEASACNSERDRV